jgi:DNA-binding transcriptional regulator YiaG
MTRAQRIKVIASPAALRAATGLTQQALAVAMGVTLRTVQGWEQGDSPCKGAALHFLKLLAGQHEQYFLTARKTESS